MALSSDEWVDRRRLKRRLGWWRVLAVGAAVLAVLAAVGRFSGIGERAHVARVAVNGIIFQDLKRDEALAKAADNDSVRALIVRIDSPGGTVVGGQSLYQRLREVAAKKPVVAVMGELGTSAAYMTAIGSDHIVAREGTLTGSIGVIMQTTDLTPLLDKIGVKPETIKSSPLKAQPNPFEPFTTEAREAMRQVVLDMYDQFVQLVADRRGMDRDKVRLLADGRVFTGRQAKDNGLVDALGGEDEARRWLKDARNIDEGVPVRDLEFGGPEERLKDLVGGVLGKSLFSETLKLDGLVSIWHPAL
jgi:protease-4